MKPFFDADCRSDRAQRYADSKRISLRARCPLSSVGASFALPLSVSFVPCSKHLPTSPCRYVASRHFLSVPPCLCGFRFALRALISRGLHRFPALPKNFSFRDLFSRQRTSLCRGYKFEAALGTQFSGFYFFIFCCVSASRWTSTITLRPEQLYEHRNP